MKDGGVYREIMTVADVEKVRAISRAKDSGPWTVWWDEMARKTVLRRLSKRLPMSSDLDDLIHRDYQPEHEDAPRQFRALATSPGERLKIDLDAIAAGGNGQPPLQDEDPQKWLAGHPPHDPETGEIREDPAKSGEIREQERADNEARMTTLAAPAGEKAAALLKAQLDDRERGRTYSNETAANLASRREDAGAGPIPPETVPASDQHLQKLINDGSVAAEKKQLKVWKARLNEKDYELVRPHFATIEKATA